MAEQVEAIRATDGVVPGPSEEDLLFEEMEASTPYAPDDEVDYDFLDRLWADRSGRLILL